MSRTAPNRIRTLIALTGLAILLALVIDLAGSATTSQAAARCEPQRTTGKSNTHGGDALMAPITLDQMTDESSLVLSGTVVAFQSCATAGAGSIFTWVTIVPDRVMKGSAGKTVRLKVPGGSYGNYRLGVGTSPEFTAGTRVVVFAGNDGPDLFPVEGDDSKLDVTPDGRAASGTLDELISAVRKATTGRLTARENSLLSSGPAVTNFLPMGPSWAAAALPVAFHMNATDSRPAQLSAQDVRTAIAHALHTWQNDTGADVAFGPLTNTTRTSADNGCDGLNDVTFGINATHGSGTLAVTYSCYSGSLMIDADVEIDVDHWGSEWRVNGQGNCDGYIDLETVLLHEFGHALGLAHPSANGGCGSCPVMDASYGSVQRTLCLDDAAGVESLYALAPGSPPAAPAGLGATRAGSVTVTWGDVTGELGFEVWRAPKSCATAQMGDFQLLDSVSLGVLTYVDSDYGSGLNPATTYCYKLRSFNTSGTSPFSNTIQSDGTGGSTPTPTPSLSPTPSPTRTPSPTPTASPTWTPSPTPTASPTPTPSPTRTPSPSPTPSPTGSPTPTPAPTATPTQPPLATASPTATPTPTPTPTPAATPTPAQTMPPPTQTASPTYTPTPTPPTPSPTRTATPTPTPTRSPSPTSTSAPSGDVDCSGTVTSVDALLILRMVAGIPGAPACMQRGDTNCDGRVDARDALHILRAVAAIAMLGEGC